MGSSSDDSSDDEFAAPHNKDEKHKMAPATTVILEDEEKERKKRGKIADVLDMMPLLGWESEGHAKPDTVLMDVSRDRADYALEQARWRNPITDSLLRARRRATESSPGATTSSTTTAVGAPVVLAKARGMEEAKLRWETPAADCYLAANRKLFENDIIDYPERYEDAHRRKGEEFAPKHLHCDSCRSPFFPEPDHQRVLSQRSTLSSTLHRPKTTKTAELPQPKGFLTASPRLPKLRTLAVGPGDYEPEPVRPAPKSARAAFVSDSERFISHKKRTPTMSAFDFVQPRKEKPKGCKISPTPRFREKPAEVVTARQLGKVNDTIMETVKEMGNAAPMYSRSERFMSFASVLHNMPSVPTLKFHSELGPGSYDLPSKGGQPMSSRRRK